MYICNIHTLYTPSFPFQTLPTPDPQTPVLRKVPPPHTAQWEPQRRPRGAVGR